MHTIIAIALVSAAQALLQCSDYCKLISYNQPIGWRPDCNCSDMKKGTLQMNPIPRDTPNVLYNSASSNIYYEPAESYPFPYIDLPFYFRNPTVPTIAKNKLPKIPNIGEEINKPFMKNYKRAHIRKINIEADELPLYLDIDIHQAGPARSTYQDVQTRIYDINKTENELMKCIDLNIVITSRQTGVIDNSIGQFKPQDMEQYNGMSDSDLISKLKEKCDLPASVIEKSLQDIKDNRPKKNPFNGRLQKKVSDKINIDETPSRKDIATDAPAAKRTIASDTKYVIENNYNDINTDTVVPDTKGSRTPAPFLQSVEINPHARTAFDHTQNDEHFKDDPKITKGYNRIMTKQTNNADLLKKYEENHERSAFQEERSIPLSTIQSFSESEQGGTSNEWELTTATVPFTGINLPNNISQYNSKDKKLYLDEKSSNYMEYTVKNEDFEINNQYVSVSSAADIANQELNYENFTSSSVTANDETTTSSANRGQYLEGEYQIPKIISRELPNNTIISDIDGNETVPNLDFVAEEIMQNTRLVSTIDNVTSEFTNSSEITTISSIIIADDANSQILLPDKLEITGQLYFQYGNSNIPARFVQNSEGKIDVGIDGASICDELFKRGENKSLLVTSLCNCVQSRNCTHS